MNWKIAGLRVWPETMNKTPNTPQASTSVGLLLCGHDSVEVKAGTDDRRGLILGHHSLSGIEALYKIMAPFIAWCVCDLFSLMHMCT